MWLPFFRLILSNPTLGNTWSLQYPYQHFYTLFHNPLMAGRHPYDDDESDSDDPDLLRALEESRAVTKRCFGVPSVPQIRHLLYKLEFWGTQQKQTCMLIYCRSIHWYRNFMKFLCICFCSRYVISDHFIKTARYLEKRSRCWLKLSERKSIDRIGCHEFLHRKKV